MEQLSACSVTGSLEARTVQHWKGMSACFTLELLEMGRFAHQNQTSELILHPQQRDIAAQPHLWITTC